MQNSDLKTKLVTQVSATHPELYQKFINLTAQIPDHVKVSLNENLSKLHVDNDKISIVLEKIINELEIIKKSLNNKNNYMLLQESEEINHPNNLLSNAENMPHLADLFKNNNLLSNTEHMPHLADLFKNNHLLSNAENMPHLADLFKNNNLLSNIEHPLLEENILNESEKHSLLNEEENILSEKHPLLEQKLIEIEEPIVISIKPECSPIIEKFLNITNVLDTLKSSFTIKNVIFVLVVLLLIYVVYNMYKK